LRLRAAVFEGDRPLSRGGPVADDEVWVRASSGGQPGRPLVIRNAPGERPQFVQMSNRTAAGMLAKAHQRSGRPC